MGIDCKLYILACSNIILMNFYRCPTNDLYLANIIIEVIFCVSFAEDG